MVPVGEVLRGVQVSKVSSAYTSLASYVNTCISLLVILLVYMCTCSTAFTDLHNADRPITSF